MSQPYDRYPGPPPSGGWPPPSAPMPPSPWPAPYGAPPLSPQRRRRLVVGWTVAGVLLAVTVLAIIAVGGFRMGSGRLADVMAPPTASAPEDWTVIGDDERFESYAERCHDGSLDACDELAYLSDPGSDYEYYGLTCGGRVERPREVIMCTDLE